MPETARVRAESGELTRANRVILPAATSLRSTLMSSPSSRSQSPASAASLIRSTSFCTFRRRSFREAVIFAGAAVDGVGSGGSSNGLAARLRGWSRFVAAAAGAAVSGVAVVVVVGSGCSASRSRWASYLESVASNAQRRQLYAETRSVFVYSVSRSCKLHCDCNEQTAEYRETGNSREKRGSLWVARRASKVPRLHVAYPAHSRIPYSGLADSSAKRTDRSPLFA